MRRDGNGNLRENDRKRMPEDRHTAGENQTAKKPLVPKHAEIVPQQNTKTPSYSQPAASSRPHWADVIIAIFTGLILLTYITSDYFLWRQLKITEGQLDQMKGGSAQTDRLIEKADSIANSMAATVKQSQMALEETLKDNRDALAKTLAQGQAALNASIESSHLDQRAWVGVVDVHPPSEVDAGERVYIKVGSRSMFSTTIHNSGKTPALKVTTSTSDASGLFAVPFLPQYDTQGEYGIPVIQPASGFTVSTSGDHTFTEAEVSAIKAGTLRIYFFGAIDYEDIFSRHHRTRFCMFLNSNLKAFMPYRLFNDAN